MYNIVEEEDRCFCLECGEPLYGRTDKKFCDGNCKNRWHRNIRIRYRSAMSPTMEGLSRNYRILERIFLLELTSCPLTRLEEMGFRPELVTHQVVKNKKHLEYRCFDYIYNMTQRKIFNLRKL